MGRNSSHHELISEKRWRWNYLLVDQIALPKAETDLYKACDNPEYLNLFAGTAYDEIADVGPLLVKVTFEHPFVQRLIEEAFDAEWGYLVNSSVELTTLATWFRKFMTVGHPSGVDLFLRFSEPAAASVLFGDQGLFRRVGGPVHELLLPDALTGAWQHSELVEETTPSTDQTVVMSEYDLERLAEVDQRNLLRRMVAHLDEFFSGWNGEATRRSQIVTLSRMLDLARQAGYVSERALTQWTNVFGFLLPTDQEKDLPEPIQSALKSIPQGRDAESAAREVAIMAREMQRIANENSGIEQTT